MKQTKKNKYGGMHGCKIFFLKKKTTLHFCTLLYFIVLHCTLLYFIILYRIKYNGKQKFKEKLKKINQMKYQTLKELQQQQYRNCNDYENGAACDVCDNDIETSLYHRDCGNVTHFKYSYN